MWLERFNIVVTSLSHDFMPFVWSGYKFEWGEIWITIGSFGWFFTWFFLFVKIMPSYVGYQKHHHLKRNNRIRKKRNNRFIRTGKTQSNDIQLVRL